MCLQWCRVQHWLIDNDLPCTGCAAYGQPGSGACATCRHQRIAESEATCALTRAPIPRTGGCCHANAPLAPNALVPVEQLRVAPWLLAAHRVTTTGALLTQHESAPDLIVRDGRAWLDPASLATPLIYGVTADLWDDALTQTVLHEPIPDAPAHVTVALTILDALIAGEPYQAAAAQLAALLTETPLDSLPAYWRETVASTLALTRHGDDGL